MGRDGRIRSRSAKAANGAVFPRAGHGARVRRSAGDGYQKIWLLCATHGRGDFLAYTNPPRYRGASRGHGPEPARTRWRNYADFLSGNVKETRRALRRRANRRDQFSFVHRRVEALKRRSSPKILRQPGEDPLRVGSSGAGPGRRPYSLAMACAEAGRKCRRRKRRFSRTDLNEANLTRPVPGSIRRRRARRVARTPPALLLEEEADTAWRSRCANWSLRPGRNVISAHRSRGGSHQLAATSR